MVRCLRILGRTAEFPPLIVFGVRTRVIYSLVYEIERLKGGAVASGSCGQDDRSQLTPDWTPADTSTYSAS